MFFEEKIETLLKNQEKLLQMIEESRIKSENQLKVYTLAQIAKVFNVTVRTIYNWKEQGILPCTVVGSKTYLTEAQLQDFLKDHEIKKVM